MLSITVGRCDYSIKMFNVQRATRKKHSTAWHGVAWQGKAWHIRVHCMYCITRVTEKKKKTLRFRFLSFIFHSPFFSPLVIQSFHELFNSFLFFVQSQNELAAALCLNGPMESLKMF